MRFSIVLVLLALFAPIFAVPVPSGRGAGKGGNNGQSGSGVKVKKATPPPAAAPGPKTPANPGDLVKVHGKDYIEGAHTTQTRTHPAIVVHHEPDTHHVHVAVLSHNHPGNPPTISSHALGMTGDETLINLGKPKVVHQNNLKPLGPPAPGKVGLPEKLDPHQLTQLHQELVNHGSISPPSSPEPEKKGKEEKEEKKIVKRQLERRSSGWPAPEDNRRCQC